MKIIENKGVVSLDLVRGLAGYFVFIFHFFLFNDQSSNLYEFITIFSVEIFFILSGFVLGKQLDLCFKNGDIDTLKIFYLRRWMRTIPIFIFILILASILNNDFLSKNFFSYFFFLKYFFNYENDYLFTIWSLSIEEWFYFLFPFLLIISNKLSLKKLNIIFIIILFLFFTKIFYLFSNLEIENFRRFTLIRLDAIIFGYLLHIFIKKIQKYFNENSYYYLTLSILFLISTYYFFINTNYFFYVYSAQISSCFIILFFYNLNFFFQKKNFLSKFSAFLANTSYCVYLSHLLVFQFIEGFILFDNLVLKLSIYITLTLFFSIFSFYLIERPFLNSRPNYGYISKFNFNITYKILTNFSLLLLFLLTSETILEKFYYKKYKITDHSIENSIANDLKNRNNQKGSAFKYSNYDIYKYREYVSKNINIDKNGYRKTINDAILNDDTKEHYNIWVFGASPIFGPFNDDINTIPALIYSNLKKKNSKKIIVKNYGVEGYNSWQSLISLQKEISSSKFKPNHIIVSIVEQDINNLFFMPKNNCNNLLSPGLNSEFALSSSWDNLANKKYFFLDFFYKYIFFQKYPNINNFISSIYYYFQKTLLINFDVEHFVANYKEKKLKYSKQIKNCFNKSLEYSSNNFLLMNTLAKKYNSKMYILYLPDLLITKKKLSKKEQIQYETYIKLFFSLNNEELKDISNIKKEHLYQKRLYSNNFHQIYENYLASIKKRLNNEEIIFIDLTKIFDQNTSDDELFETLNHFTDKGSNIISKEIIKNIKLN